MSKRILALLVCTAFMLSACSASSNVQETTEPIQTANPPAAVTPAKTTLFNSGAYTAVGTGMCGAIPISVTFSDNKIETITIGENNETYMVGSEAIRILPDRIVKQQTLGVDVVAGATYTSYAIIYGVRDCVAQAGGDIDALLAVPVKYETYEGMENKADIIIVGGGMAGLTTMSSALDNGSNVILLEQHEFLGGNTSMAAGTTLLGGGTTIQQGLGIEDDRDSFYNWILENSEYKKDPMQSAWLADYSQDIINYLVAQGVKFNTEKINATSGSPVSRGHLMTPTCAYAIKALGDSLHSRGGDIRYGIRINDFVFDATGKIIGVQGTNIVGDPVEYYGDNIVLATGGWGANNEMVAKYWGAEYGGLVYGGAAHIDGQMLLKAVDLGADLVDMDDVHIDATLSVKKSIVVFTNILTNMGGMIIRAGNGERIADEQGLHGEWIAAKMHECGDDYYYEIFSENAFTYSEAYANKINDYINMDIIAKYDTIEELSAVTGVSVENLQATFDSFNASVRGEEKDVFGRESFYGEITAPYYFLEVKNGLVCTTGGLKINEKMQVIKTDGIPLDNLYAVGEIVGGYLVHYVAGDSVARSAIAGWLLGQYLTD